MLYELRQYRIHPGQRDNWVKFMEEVIIPFQVKKGMVITASFVAEEEPDLYVWLRRFESEEERVRLYKDVYESDEWQNEIAPHTVPMLIREKIQVLRLVPTAKSVLR